jgi:hypothetical protein
MVVVVEEEVGPAELELLMRVPELLGAQEDLAFNSQQHLEILLL